MIARRQEPLELAIAFEASEDRLVLRGRGAAGENVLLLTRRLTLRLINGVASALEKSSIHVKRASSELHSDIILMEHQRVIARSGDGGLASTKRSLKAQKPMSSSGRLVASVALSIKPRKFHLSFQTQTGEPTTIDFGRGDLHLFLEALQRQANNAEWNLHLDASWLGPRSVRPTMN